MEKTQILIGSKNPVKIKAVQSVFTKFFPDILFEFRHYDVPSQVSPQPWGNDETIQGAIFRAKNALTSFIQDNSICIQTYPNSFYYIGIEAGLIPIPQTVSGYMDIQYCAIFDKMGHFSLGAGSGWEYPKKIIDELKLNPNLEIGTIMARLENDPDVKYKNGAIGYYSQNKITRPALTEECVKMALIPFLNPGLYYPKD